MGFNCTAVDKLDRSYPLAPIAQYEDSRLMGRIRNWATVVLVLVFVLVVGLILAYVGARESRADNDLWSRYSAAGVGLAVTVVAGLLVTVSLRVVDGARSRDQELRRLFLEIVKAYNQIKGSRRELRALGLATPSFGRERTETLSSDDVKELHSCLSSLNQAQLALEQVKRDAGQSRLFSDSILRQLQTIESYINVVVVEKWERHGPKLRDGSPVTLIDDLGLMDFVAYQSETFERCVSEPLRQITKYLNEQMYGKPRRGAR
jgi:hypothetical protein